MKKVVSSLLLLIFLLQLLSPAITFRIIRRLIKEEVAMDISLGKYSSSITFSLSSPESDFFEWENETEFFYEGTWYDVIEKKNDQLYCIKDGKETSLFTEWKKFTDPSQVNSFVKLLEQQLKKTISIISHENTSVILTNTLYRIFIPYKDLFHLPVITSIFSPPPNL